MHFKKILNEWVTLLKSPESCYVLTEDGWNDFFTRELSPNAQPIANKNDPKVFVSACEAGPFRVEWNVK